MRRTAKKGLGEDGEGIWVWGEQVERKVQESKKERMLRKQFGN